VEISVLGGFSVIGQSIVGNLLEHTDSNLVIADTNVLNVQDLFPYAQNRITTFKIHPLKPDTIKKAVINSQVVINCMVPFSQYGVPIAKTLVELGKNFIDICNDPRATLGILKLDSMAKKMKVTAVTGMGFTPGLSNLLIMKAASTMDQIDSIKIHWVSSAQEYYRLNQLDHLISLVSEDLPTFKNRRRTSVKPFSESELDKFPHPFGFVKVSQVGHPEALTLPTYIDVANISVKGALTPHWMEKLLLISGKKGLERLDGIRDKYTSTLNNLYGFLSPGSSTPTPLTALKIKVEGKKMGLPVIISLNTIGSLSRLISLPVTIALLFMLEGEITSPGIHPPEGIIDEAKALVQMSRHGLVYTFSERFLSI
jgi:saccharopine dehydrogenase-like NADP-dependent oxidoreductase